MKLFFSFCLSVSTFGANAQAFSVAADKMDIAYTRIDNPLTIVANNSPCSELFATTDNGTIQKGDSCHFYYSPENVGKAIISLQRKQGGKMVKIGTEQLRVKALPFPVTVVGNRQSGIYPLALFKVQTKLSVKFEGVEMDIEGAIASFRISFIRNSQVFYNGEIVGDLFNDLTSAAFRQLKSGDVVKIENVKYMGGRNFCPSIIQGLTFTMQ